MICDRVDSIYCLAECPFNRDGVYCLKHGKLLKYIVNPKEIEVHGK